MTEPEKAIHQFNANAAKCQRHSLPVILTFDGVWAIECPKGCSMHDGDHGSPTPLILRYSEKPL